MSDDCLQRVSSFTKSGKRARQNRKTEQVFERKPERPVLLTSCICVFVSTFASLREEKPPVLLKSFRAVVSGPHSGSVWTC